MATSFLLMNQGVKGALYLMENASPMVAIPASLSCSSIFLDFVSNAFPPHLPENLRTARRLGANSIAVDPGSDETEILPNLHLS